eukprot:1772192-Pyramimonas_sp.AAC.1
MLEPAACAGEEVELPVPEEGVSFWAQRSERATIPSVAAAMGVPNNERDYLGKWSPGASGARARARRVVDSWLQR